MSDLKEGERQQVIQTVKDGSKSEYWNILRGQIVAWAEDENRILNGFKKTGIRNNDDVEKYNRALDRLEYLKRFLSMNETIINFNFTILERLKHKVVEVYKFGESFVKEKVS